MAKFFAITIIVIAIASAIPILRHTWPAPAGHFDSRAPDRRADVGDHDGGGNLVSGRAVHSGDLYLEIFQPDDRTRKSRNFPAEPRDWSSPHFCWWARKFWPSEFLAPRPGRAYISRLPRLTPCPSRCRPDSSLSTSAIPGRTESLVRSIPNRSTRRTQNFFGLDPDQRCWTPKTTS